MRKLMATPTLTGLATSISAAGIHIEDGWARATIEGMKVGGTFVKAQNDEARRDFLVGGSNPVTGRVEAHAHINGNGVMRMREIRGGAPLAAKGVTELRPDSYRIMFMGLRERLEEGEKVLVTLKFKDAKPQTVELEVKTAPKAEVQHDYGAHGDAHRH